MKQWMECPCCGDDGAESDDDGMWFEGQPLTCGCNGHVAISDDGEAYIIGWDLGPCPNKECGR